MRLIKREVTVKDIHTINMNVTEGQLKISRYNGDILDINGKLGFWTRNIKTYSKDSIAFIEIKPRIFKPKFLKTMPSEIELKIPKECKMNLNLYLGKVDLEISDLKLNILSIKAEESKINLINVKKETFNEEIGKSKIVIEEFERYEEIDNLGIIELETGLSFTGNDLNDFYIDIEEFSSNKKKMKKLGYGENTSSKDIIINNYF